MNDYFCAECKITFADFCHVVKSGASQLFKSLGYHITEKIYQQALANYIIKKFDTCLKCAHSNQEIKVETQIDVLVSEEKCGSLRSDLQLCWKPIEDEEEHPPKVIIELKAKGDNINDRAIMQLLAYMQTMKMKRGILINFLQKSTLITDALRKSGRKRNRDEFKDLICISLEKLTEEPVVEFKIVLLQ